MEEKKPKLITSVSNEQRKIPPKKQFSSKAHIKSEEEYKKIYQESIKDPEKFWAEKAKQLHWFKQWDTIFTWDPKNIKATWFKGGKINVSYNCLDINLKKRASTNIQVDFSFRTECGRIHLPY